MSQPHRKVLTMFGIRGSARLRLAVKRCMKLFIVLLKVVGVVVVSSFINCCRVRNEAIKR